MDFTRHETEASQTARSAGSAGVGGFNAAAQHKTTSSKSLTKWTKVGYTTLLFAVTILVVSIAGLIAFSNNGQSGYVDGSKFQAVFINDGSSNGQSVYFGHITKLDSSYLVLDDVYYITTNSSSTSTTTSTSANNYSLTKLGCQQLHDPYDQMVINTSQVAFWENLQNSGKVVTAIEQFQKDNPKGPNCSESSSTVSSSSTTQNSGSTQNP